MLKKDIRKKLTEVKETKDKLLVEQKIVKSRIITIFGNENNIKNFHRLSESKKQKITKALSREIIFLKENNILTEQSSSLNLADTLKGIFGSAFLNIMETLVEPFVSSALAAVGISGYFNKFITSVLTTNYEKLIDAWGDCRLMTELFAAGIVEGMFMQLQEKLGAGESPGYSILRNVLGKVIKNQEFIKSLSDQLQDIVCGVLDKISGNAQKVAEKLKPETSK